MSPAAALLAAAVACAAAQPAWTAGGGGRVVIGVRSDVSSFNPYNITNAFSQEVIDLLLPRLAWEQDDFRDGPPGFRPGIASSWEMSADRLTLTFHLDPEARWSDGTPITAADVLFSHRAAASAEVAWVGMDVKEFIESVESPDPHTVVYRFRRAYPYQLMDAVEGNILPAAAYRSPPLAAWPRHAFLEAPVTAGPFRLRRHEPGSLIELVRDPSYARSPHPHLESVVFRVLPDETALVNELLAGGIDMLENLPSWAVDRVAASPRLRVIRVPDLAYTFVCWNTARPPFDDPRVRRALTLAVDREAILEGLLPGVGRPAAGPILSFLWARDPSLEPSPFDPATARRLLQKAGWTDGDGDGIRERQGAPLRFELETNSESRLRTDVVQMIAAQLRRVGAEAVPRTFQYGAFIERHERHDFDAFVGSWRESTKVDLKSAFHSASIDGGVNYGSYANAELDRVIDRARVEPDAGRAAALWARAQAIIAAEHPYTFLFERDRLHAVPRRLAGVRPSPRSAYVHLEEWHWEPEAKAQP